MDDDDDDEGDWRKPLMVNSAAVVFETKPFSDVGVDGTTLLCNGETEGNEEQLDEDEEDEEE